MFGRSLLRDEHLDTTSLGYSSCSKLLPTILRVKVAKDRESGKIFNVISMSHPTKELAVIYRSIEPRKDLLPNNTSPLLKPVRERSPASMAKPEVLFRMADYSQTPSSALDEYIRVFWRNSRLTTPRTGRSLPRIQDSRLRRHFLHQTRATAPSLMRTYPLAVLSSF